MGVSRPRRPRSLDSTSPTVVQMLMAKELLRKSGTKAAAAAADKRDLEPLSTTSRDLEPLSTLSGQPEPLTAPSALAEAAPDSAAEDASCRLRTKLAGVEAPADPPVAVGHLV